MLECNFIISLPNIIRVRALIGVKSQGFWFVCSTSRCENKWRQLTRKSIIFWHHGEKIIAVLFFTTRILSQEEDSNNVMMKVLKTILVWEKTNESRRPVLVPERRIWISPSEEKISRCIFHNLPKSVQISFFLSRNKKVLVPTISVYGVIYGKFTKSQETGFHNFQIIAADCLLIQSWVAYSCLYNFKWANEKQNKRMLHFSRVKCDLISTNEIAPFLISLKVAFKTQWKRFHWDVFCYEKSYMLSMH